jgi:hypothetical protein
MLHPSDKEQLVDLLATRHHHRVAGMVEAQSQPVTDSESNFTPRAVEIGILPKTSRLG